MILKWHIPECALRKNVYSKKKIQYGFRVGGSYINLLLVPNHNYNKIKNQSTITINWRLAEQNFYIQGSTEEAT